MARSTRPEPRTLKAITNDLKQLRDEVVAGGHFISTGWEHDNGRIGAEPSLERLDDLLGDLDYLIMCRSHPKRDNVSVRSGFPVSNKTAF